MEESSDSLASVGLQPEATRGGIWRWACGLAGFALVAAVVGGLLFRVPYVALVPGTAKDTEPLVKVEGIEAYPSDGELLFTTVRVRQRPNLWEYLWLQTDDDAVLLQEDDILQGRSLDENREFNLQLMNDSKSVAIAVALNQLGYDSIRSDGVIIAQVVANSAAAGKLDLGDTLVAIDGLAVRTTDDLLKRLAHRAPGDEVSLTVEPYNPDVSAAEKREQKTLKVTLGANPDDPTVAFLGVGPSDRVRLNDEFDFTVDIDSGSVGGPSAGLAFTLAVLDQLTVGELTGGAKVAVTGTIDADGHVGAVGGIIQKTAAVRDLGADAFIVPASLGEDELSQVMKRAGDALRIIPVDNLVQALAALATLGGEVGAVEEYAAGNLS